MSDPFVSQLATLCSNSPTAPKWVIVPTHARGHTIGDRLVLEGTNWVNLRFKTPFDLALEMAAPFLVEQGLNPVPDDIGPLLIMRLLVQLPAEVPSYFRRFAYQPPMAAALWQTVWELRMAGIEAPGLPEAAFENHDKHAELTALLVAYEQHLRTHGLADTAAVFAEAINRPDYCPILPADARVEPPDVVWPPLVRRFLDGLPGTPVEPAVLSCPGLSTPGRMQAQPLAAHSTKANLIEAAGTSPPRDVSSLRFLMQPEAASPTREDGSLKMFQAGGKDAEIEEVFRRIAATGRPLDSFEVAYASADYPLLIWQKAKRDGWPLTLSSGIPVVVTRPGRALLGFLEWVETGYSESRLRRLLQSGDVHLNFDEGPSAPQAARVLLRAHASWGRGTYSTTLCRLAESDRRRALDPDAEPESRERWTTRADHATRLGEWLERLLELLPEAGAAGASVSLTEVTTAARQFVLNRASRSGPLDHAAVDVITVALDQLAAVGDVRRPLDEVIRLVRSTFEELTVGSERARPGRLHVTRLDRAGWDGRPHTFVVGLEEGRVFPSLVEDPVLLDDERGKIDGQLATSGDRATEAVHAVIARLASIGASSSSGGSVTLSYSCRDLRQCRETFPSWLLLQVRRLGGSSASVTYETLLQGLGEPVSVVPATSAEAISDSGWWMSQFVHSGVHDVTPLLEGYPFLGQGRHAESQRRSTSFTVHDGHVPQAGPLLDPRVNGRPMSATRLEGLARCPFAYFLESGLGLDAVDEREPDRDVWLDPLTRGSELHALYAQVMRRLRAEGRPVEFGVDRAWLHERADERIRALRTVMPPPSDAVFQRERGQLLRDLDLFLRFEAEGERAGRTPVALEVGFGIPHFALSESGEGDELEPLATDEPVQLSLGDSQFLLRGRIDRIDRTGGHEYEVVDYKTGSYFRPNYGGTFREGRLLQHALYGLVAAELLRAQDPDARITAGVYYFPSAKAGGQVAYKARPSSASTAAVLTDLFDAVAVGAFVHTPLEENCKFCDFQGACGPGHREQAEAKIRHPGNIMLDAYRKLSTHE